MAQNHLPTAMDRLILAMCQHQLGKEEAARQDLERARSLIEKGLNYGFDKYYWRDWVIARILLREATGLLTAAPELDEPTAR